MINQNTQQTNSIFSASKPHHQQTSLQRIMPYGQDIPAGMDFLLNYKQIIQIFNCSRTTIWRKIQGGDFPQPIKLSAGRDLKWRASQIIEYLNNLSQ